MEPVSIGSWWQHVRTGWLYQVVGLGRIERTAEEAVIYRGADGTVWVRPLSEWQQEVMEGQAQGHAPRFSPICAPARVEMPEMLANGGEDALRNTANLCVVTREWLEETVDRLRELHRIKRGGRTLATDWKLGADLLTVHCGEQLGKLIDPNDPENTIRVPAGSESAKVYGVYGSPG